MTVFLTFALKYWREIAFALSVAAAVTWYNIHVHTLIAAAKQEAVMDNNKVWQEHEAKAIAEAKAQAQSAYDQHDRDLKAIIQKQTTEAANAKTQHDHDVAAIRAGTLRLRIPDSVCAGGPSLPPTAADSHPAPEGIALPDGLAERLFALADEADANLSELNACWQIVASDRKAFSTTKGSP